MRLGREAVIRSWQASCDQSRMLDRQDWLLGAQRITWMARFRAGERQHQGQVWKKWPGHMYLLGFHLPAHTTADKQCLELEVFFSVSQNNLKIGSQGLVSFPRCQNTRLLPALCVDLTQYFHMMPLEPESSSYVPGSRLTEGVQEGYSMHFTQFHLYLVV